MPFSLTIPNKLSYPPSMDYQLLRREGLRHIERLGSAIWTDYNSHDPGITILEVLCYALTDLGYRTQLPVNELFSPSGNKKAFFTSAEILPNAPVTALDFRKILIDIEGVKNAWLEGCVDSDVLFQLKTDAVNLKIPRLEEYLSVFGDPSPISISFLLKGEEILTNYLKKENNEINKIEYLASFNKYFEFESYKKAVFLYLLDIGFENNYLPKTEELIDLKLAIRDYWQNADNIDRLNKVNEKYANIINENINEINNLCANFLRYQLLANSLKSVKKTEIKEENKSIFNPKGIYKIYLQLEDRFEYKVEEIKAKALKRLHENRALCEDFAEIVVIDSTMMGVNCKIEISPETELTKVYADILFALNEYLSPTIKMYSLQEMLDKYASFELNANSFEALIDAELPAEVIKNLESLKNQQFIGIELWKQVIDRTIGNPAMEEYWGIILNQTAKIYESNKIFEGPLLTHGFIDDNELKVANWRRTIYKSDLFQVISKVEGVVKIQQLAIHKCPEDDENSKKVESEWCLSFDCDCQPTLNLDAKCSKFEFTKGGFPVTPNKQSQYEVLDLLEQLKAQNIKIDRTNERDLPIPKGKQRDDLAEYTSIQEEFPNTYHVGSEGIVATESPLRKAQVKQMKGFLMFFDQILNNYLAHLSQIRDVLAIESDSEKLQLFQPLYDAPKVKNLFTSFNPQNETWENFINNPNNSYIEALKNLTNGSSVTQKLRENGILDHLLARFGENFTDYVLELFKIDIPVDENSNMGDGISDWTNDKKRFLKNLPEIGSLRGRGFNYKAEPILENAHFWRSTNIEGFKRRVFAQLGIEDWNRNTISCEPSFKIAIDFNIIRKQKRYFWGIKATEEATSYLMKSTATYGQEDSAITASELYFNCSSDLAKYNIISEDNFHYVVFGENITISENSTLVSEPFKTLAEADKLKYEIKNLIENNCQSESFHCIEHILLRPLDEYYTLLKPIIISEDLSRLDPYSFYISIIIPDWGDRFSNPKQLAYFVEMVRNEVPAHIAIRFSKLNKEKMLSFEQAYFNWLNVKTNPNVDLYDLRQNTNILVELLNNYTYE